MEQNNANQNSEEHQASQFGSLIEFNGFDGPAFEADSECSDSQLSELEITDELQTAARRNPWTPWSAAQRQYLRELKMSPAGYTFAQIAQLLNQRFGTRLRANQCQQRWHRCEDSRYKKGRWDAVESDKLVSLYEKFNGDLKLVKQEFCERTLLQIQKRLRILGVLQ